MIDIQRCIAAYYWLLYRISWPGTTRAKVFIRVNHLVKRIQRTFRCLCYLPFLTQQMPMEQYDLPLMHTKLMDKCPMKYRHRVLRLHS